MTATPQIQQEKPGPRLYNIKFRVDQEREIAEGGLLHILEKMWVGLAIIEVGSLPLRRGSRFVIPSESEHASGPQPPSFRILITACIDRAWLKTLECVPSF